MAESATTPVMARARRCLIAAGLFLGGCAFSPGLFPQEAAATIPETLRMPGRGEAPRYPQDLVIGELGQGGAPAEAYRLALEILEALRAGDRTAPALENFLNGSGSGAFEEIGSLVPRTFRLGGGRTEADGSVSFLVRFLGAEESVTGELYLRRRDSAGYSESKSGTPEPDSGETADTGPEAGGDLDGGAVSPLSGEDSPAPGGEARAGPDTGWLLDDLVLEEKRALSGITDSYRYDFSPYERFY